MYANTLPPTSDTALLPEDVDLRTTLRDGIQTPLAALQATLEDLAKQFPRTDGRVAILANAVRSVERIARQAQGLADYALEPRLAPLSCSLEELARCAYRSTPPELRGAVQLAVEDPEVRVFVDGPLCSRLLSYLVHACTEFHDEALFHVRADAGQAVFNLISAPSPAGATRVPLHTSNGREHVNDLFLIVAERELSRMGGHIQRSRSTTGVQRVSVRLPLASRTEEVV